MYGGCDICNQDLGYNHSNPDFWSHRGRHHYFKRLIKKIQYWFQNT